MMSSIGIKRMIRPAKTADSSGTGDSVLAELQAKLRGRRESTGEGSNPSSRKAATTAKKLRSFSPEKPIATERPIAGQTKESVRPSLLDQSLSGITSAKVTHPYKDVRALTKASIPPPPKNPPPQLPRKITNKPKSVEKSSLEKSLSSAPTNDGEETEDRKYIPQKTEAHKILKGTKSVGGVKELRQFFSGGGPTQRMNKTISEPKDVGKRRVPTSSEPAQSPRPTRSKLEERKEESTVTGGDQESEKGKKPLWSVLEGKSLTRSDERSQNDSWVSTSDTEFTSSNESGPQSSNPSIGYQNVFDDETFARFDKRSDSPKSQQDGGSVKKDKKPRPLPRKSSVSNMVTSSSASNTNKSTTTPNQDGVHSDDPKALPEREEGTQNSAASNSSSMPSRVIVVCEPLAELENEIDLLADIAKLPPLTEVTHSHDEPTLKPPQKQLAGKTKSHNPGGEPIKRRNTPKERKELRHGVRSDSDSAQGNQDNDIDDYIRMDPAELAEMTELVSSLKEQQFLTPPTDDKSSAYYLKILPSNCPESSPDHSPKTPKSPGDIYIDMEHSLELNSLPTNFIHRRETPVATKPTSHSLGSHGRLKPKNKDRFRLVNYAEVTVAQANSDPGANKVTDEGGREREVAIAIVPPRSSPIQIGRKEYNVTDSSTSSLKSQWSFLTNEEIRPLPSPTTESESTPSYITTREGHLVPVKVAGRTTKWHEYIEIDEKEIEKMASSLNSSPRLERSATPPEVPKRPESFDELVERRNITSTEYSYAAVPGHSIFGYQWMNFHARNLAEKSSPPSTNAPKLLTPPSKRPTPPRYAEGKDIPPSLPPKSDSLLREQGLIPAYVGMPNPYLIPLSTKKRKLSSPPDILVTTKASSTAPRDVIAHVKRENMGKKKATTVGKEDLQRKTQSEKPGKQKKLPPPRPAPPNFAYLHVKQSSEPVARIRSGFVPISSSTQAEDDPPPSTNPPHYTLRSQSEGDLLNLRETSPVGGLSRPASQAPPSSDNQRVHGREEEASPGYSPNVRRREKFGVQNKLDRRSLAIIMQNREALVKQLSIGGNTDPSGMVQDSATHGTQKQTLVRSLGEILLEIDTLLRNRVCTEEDLISAIEARLSIKLQSVKGEESKKHSTDPEASEPLTSREQMTRSSSVEITEEDVEDVKSFVSANRVTSPDGESDLNLELDFPPPRMKPRSSTFIINLDPSSSSSENTQTSESSQPDACAEESTDDSRGNKFSQSSNCFTDRGNLLSPPALRDSRSLSTGHKRLKRTNAKRRPSLVATELEAVNSGSIFCDGAGVFTHKGGKLTNVTSGVEIVIPEGAIPKGKKQRIWFDVLQPVFDLKDEDELLRSHSDPSTSAAEQAELLTDKRSIQLSPMVLVGPCDISLAQPIKIKLPHCLPYRNNSWNLHMLARAQNSKSEEWVKLPNSTGLIIPPSKQKRKVFKNSTYQMHLEYAQVTTKQLGYFKLSGHPIRNGSHTAKRMVASVYTKGEEAAEDVVLLKIFMTNSIHDQVQVSLTIVFLQ